MPISSIDRVSSGTDRALSAKASRVTVPEWQQSKVIEILLVFAASRCSQSLISMSTMSRFSFGCRPLSYGMMVESLPLPSWASGSGAVRRDP